MNKLMGKPFACEEDANLAVDEFKKQSALLGFEQTCISKEPIYNHRGRPKKGEKPTGYSYQINATVFNDLGKVKLAKLKVSMFILATNDTNSSDLDMASLLAHYKSQ